MKSFGLLILLFSSLAFASVQKSDRTPFTEKTFECKQYTDNKFSSHLGFESDNPANDEVTVVHQKEHTFEIEKNKVWKDGATMSNDVANTKSGYAGNGETIFFKKHNETGQPYFVAFFFDKDEAYRAVVLGQCARK